MVHTKVQPKSTLNFAYRITRTILRCRRGGTHVKGTTALCVRTKECTAETIKGPATSTNHTGSLQQSCDRHLKDQVRNVRIRRPKHDCKLHDYNLHDCKVNYTIKTCRGSTKSIHAHQLRAVMDAGRLLCCPALIS